MDIFPSAKIKVLFVCLGNICRSPIAQAVFQKLVEDEQISENFEIDSAGTSGYHDGELADPRTRKIAEEDGISVTHLSRRITLKDMDYFDFIIVMDKSNLANLLGFAKNEIQRSKIKLFREFERQALSLEVPDPYYGQLKDFKNVQDIVKKSSLGFLEYLKALNLIRS